jgi:hypothetical protein
MGYSSNETRTKNHNSTFINGVRNLLTAAAASEFLRETSNNKIKTPYATPLGSITISGTYQSYIQPI